jgi:hypothetical protein
MRYALIDNASLTAIQRLLGNIPIKNKAIIDADIVAFENYITAILFYDYIICIDDYKPQYREKRTALFDDIRFISKNIIEYNEIEKQASKLTSKIALKIKTGQITDKDYKEYFESLAMNMTFTWDMSSSLFYLTQKLLINSTDKNVNLKPQDKIHSAIISETFEKYNILKKERKIEPILYDKFGNEFTSHKTKEDLFDGYSYEFKLFSSGLTWLSDRTSFYTLAADYLKADLFLYPIRQSFLSNVLNKIDSTDFSKYTSLLSSFKTKTRETVNEIKHIDEAFILKAQFPLFSSYLAQETMDSKSIVEAAYQLRENSVFKKSRQHLRELELMLADKDRDKYIKKINGIHLEVMNELDKLKSSYNVDNNKGINMSSIAVIWNMTPLSNYIKLPNINLNIKELDFMNNIIPSKGFSGVFRNLTEDLVSIEKLGGTHDILTGNVNIQPGGSYYEIKKEEERYKKASSYWKKPMK